MGKKNDGGMAFPVVADDFRNVCEGMSLRDYFAARAMQAILSRTGGIEIKQFTKNCYDIADEMIKARE